MGVKELWSILEPVKKKQTLSDLSNKTLCVDLSFWVCEALHSKELSSHVNKPHLRNLFYRFCNLTRFRVKLVFVLDGKPPELKWEAMKRRIEATRGGPSRNTLTENLRIEGSYFAECVREVSLKTKGFLLRFPCLPVKDCITEMYLSLLTRRHSGKIPLILLLQPSDHVFEFSSN